MLLELKEEKPFLMHQSHITRKASASDHVEGFQIILNDILK